MVLLKRVVESTDNRSAEELNKLVSLPRVSLIFDGDMYKVLLFGRSTYILVDTTHSYFGHYNAYYRERYNEAADEDSSTLKDSREKLLDKSFQIYTDPYTKVDLPQCVFDTPYGYRVVIRQPDGHIRELAFDQTDTDLPTAIQRVGWFGGDIEDVFKGSIL